MKDIPGKEEWKYAERRAKLENSLHLFIVFSLVLFDQAEQVRKCLITSACHRKLYLLDCPGIVPPSPSDFEADCAKAWKT